MQSKNTNQVIKDKDQNISRNTGNKPQITRDSNIAEIIFRFPDVAEVFMDYGLHCVGCIASGFDTVEMGAKVHSMSDEEIDEMIQRANEVIEFSE